MGNRDTWMDGVGMGSRDAQVDGLSHWDFGQAVMEVLPGKLGLVLEKMEFKRTVRSKEQRVSWTGRSGGQEVPSLGSS